MAADAGPIKQPRWLKAIALIYQAIAALVGVYLVVAAWQSANALAVLAAIVIGFPFLQWLAYMAFLITSVPFALVAATFSTFTNRSADEPVHAQHLARPVVANHRASARPVHVASVVVEGDRRDFARFTIDGGEAHCRSLIPPSEPGDPRALSENMILEQAWLDCAAAYGVEPRNWDGRGFSGFSDRIQWEPPLPTLPPGPLG